MKKYNVGYTQGVFDMFHVGHLNLINTAKEHCDYLIVGINSDMLVQNYKKKTPVINENERRLIVSNLKNVDEVIITNTLDKVSIAKEFSLDVIFIGDDWKDSKRWVQTKEELARYDVDVLFLPYTKDISSTILRTVENQKVEE